MFYLLILVEYRISTSPKVSFGYRGVPDVEYVFTVNAFKGVDDAGAAAWSQLRSDNASCTVSTTAAALPHVSIDPKVRKYGPRPMCRVEKY